MRPSATALHRRLRRETRRAALTASWGADTNACEGSVGVPMARRRLRTEGLATVRGLLFALALAPLLWGAALIAAYALYAAVSG